MFIKAEDVQQMDDAYGPAKRVAIEPIKMKPWEFQLLKKSRKNGRRHDVTMFIRKKDAGGKFVCIQKPYYEDTGIYRAPSGGVNVGESIEHGLKREMREETGFEVQIDGFPLIIDTEFIAPDGSESEKWTSYIFSGHDVGGVMVTQDPREISDLKLFGREELLGPIEERMLASGWGGFKYRVELTRQVFKII